MWNGNTEEWTRAYREATVALIKVIEDEIAADEQALAVAGLDWQPIADRLVENRQHLRNIQEEAISSMERRLFLVTGLTDKRGVVRTVAGGRIPVD